jgi:hypothetical protein
MNRKVKKLTEVLSFADSAGMKVLLYFFQWFNEESRRTNQEYKPETRLLMSAASRVLKKLARERVHGFSARDSDLNLFRSGSMPMGSKGEAGGKNKEDIEKLLKAELIEVAQRTDAARILHRLLGIKMQRRIRRGAP